MLQWNHYKNKQMTSTTVAFNKGNRSAAEEGAEKCRLQVKRREGKKRVVTNRLITKPQIDWLQNLLTSTTRLYHHTSICLREMFPQVTFYSRECREKRMGSIITRTTVIMFKHLQVKHKPAKHTHTLANKNWSRAHAHINLRLKLAAFCINVWKQVASSRPVPELD